jgi:hypothetical protein
MYFKVGGENYYPIIAAFIRITTPIIAIFFGYLSINFFGLKSKQGKSVFFMTLSIIFAWFGTIPWIMQTPESTMVAHIFYLLVRPFFAFSIFYSIGVIDPDFFRNFKKIISYLIAFFILLIFYFKIFHFDWTYATSSLEHAILSIYLVMDFFLLTFAILTIHFIYLSFQGTYGLSWIPIGLGALSFWVSEIWYVSNSDSYYLGHVIDLGWVFGYIFFAFYFVLLKHNAEQILEEYKHEKTLKK